MENLRRWQSSRKAHRAHLTKLQRTVAEIMDSSESPEDSALDSLSISIEKLQRKAKAIGELYSKFLVSYRIQRTLMHDQLYAITKKLNKLLY